MSDHQNEGHNYDLMIVIKDFENMSRVRYLGKTETCQNWIHEEIKSKLKTYSSESFVLLSPL
jgi:hypothetical protein